MLRNGNTFCKIYGFRYDSYAGDSSDDSDAGDSDDSGKKKKKEKKEPKVCVCVKRDD